MRRQDDILWKVVMEEVFDDLLRFCFPDAEEVYDLQRGFEFMEKELGDLDPEPQKDPSTRFADKLVKVFNRNGDEEWVLLHVEVQGDTADKSQFAKRMFTYFYRILDRYRRPVSAIAIFTGRDAKRMPDRYEYAYRTTRLTYQYHTISILDFSDSELEKQNNPFALIVLAAKTALATGKIPDQQLLERKIELAHRLLEKGYRINKILAIFRFLQNTILFENPELNRIFKEQVKPHDKSNIMGIREYEQMVGREEGRQEGREEGREEGRQEGREAGKEEGRQEERRIFVETLISQTEFSDEKIASFAKVGPDLVKEFRANRKSL